MKTKNNHLGIIKKVLCLAMAFTIAFTAVSPMTASAKAKKVELKWANQAVTGEQVEKTAKTVKTGTYTITQKKNKGNFYQGYLKFVAPKTKEYSFTISKVNAKNSKYGVLGSVIGELKGASASDITSAVQFNTKGGKNGFLNVSTKKTNKYIPNRTGKIKLQKGQTLYLHYMFVGAKKSNSFTSKLVIK